MTTYYRNEPISSRFREMEAENAALKRANERTRQQVTRAQEDTAAVRREIAHMQFGDQAEGEGGSTELADFVASLSPKQRAFFVAHQQRTQALLRQGGHSLK